MSMSVVSERKFLSHDELTVVEKTHYPALAELDAGALRESRSQLRQLRDKSRTIAGHKRREVRGKGEKRAAGASGSAEHAARRKQIFSHALRRTNSQLQRVEHAAARARTRAGAERALAMAREAEIEAHHPDPGRLARRGMRPNPSLRRARGVPGTVVGSVSKAGKVAQAKRDKRG